MIMTQFINNNNNSIKNFKLRVFQDYHVILLQIGLQSDPLVYDLDSELSFPCSLQLYATQALRSEHNIKPAYHR